MTISTGQGNGYGPLGTPNAGRAERIARQERSDALRYRAAASRMDRDRGKGNEIDQRTLRIGRALQDALAELRAEMRSHDARIAALEASLPALRDETAEALFHLARAEVSRNGTQATR
jgi:hypothetical protein